MACVYFLRSYNVLAFWTLVVTCFGSFLHLLLNSLVAFFFHVLVSNVLLIYL